MKSPIQLRFKSGALQQRLQNSLSEWQAWHNVPTEKEEPMDIRATPYPADFPILSTPGHFKGWAITVDIDGHVESVTICKSDGPAAVAKKLRELADQVGRNEP